MEAQRQLEEATRESTAAAIAHAGRLEASAAASGEQTSRVIALTEQLQRLTIVIVWLTGFSVLFGSIQAGAILVHLYRWYRGW